MGIASQLGTVQISNRNARAGTVFEPMKGPKRGGGGKLTPEQVREVRSSGRSMRELAKQYDLSEAYLKKVREGITYAWVY